MEDPTSKTLLELHQAVHRLVVQYNREIVHTNELGEHVVALDPRHRIPMLAPEHNGMLRAVQEILFKLSKERPQL